MNEMPTKPNWANLAIVVLAGLTAFLSAWQAFNGNDANQDRKIAALAVVVCLENETRAEKCKRLGLVQ